MELEEKVFKMIDEELEKLEKAIDKLRKDNELENLEQDNV